MQEKLKKLLNNSYSPYSQFRVAAILVTNDDQEFSGVNVENASYGATICAERSAIFNAVSHGYTKGDFKKLYVMTDSRKISSCCFLCRQVICEFFLEDSLVILSNNLGETKKYKVKDLCPLPFNGDDLK